MPVDPTQKPSWHRPTIELRRSAGSVRLLLICLLGVSATIATSLPAAASTSSPTEAADERRILVTFEQRPTWRAPRAGTSGLSHHEGYKASARTRRLVSRVAAEHQLEEVDSWLIRPLDIHCVVFEVRPDVALDDLMARIEADERVESVQPMQHFDVQSSSYDDPYLELQHGVASMQIEAAHRWATGNDVRVAVIDTGVDTSHPELSGSIQLFEDFVDGPGGGGRPDRHGTAVAGVIASSANNGYGIVGVAPAARILALRACWQDPGKEGEGRCNSFTIAKALTFAIEQRPEILNMSLGGPRDALLERLMSRALDLGIVVVAAVGAGTFEGFPTGIDGVIGVRSSGLGSTRTAVGGSTLSAPGNEIITTVPAGGFDFLSGSSFASAHVAGVAALMLERRADLRGDELLRLLLETSVAPRPAVADGAVGEQTVNACAALARIVANASCGPPLIEAARPDTPSDPTTPAGLARSGGDQGPGADDLDVDRLRHP